MEDEERRWPAFWRVFWRVMSLSVGVVRAAGEEKGFGGVTSDVGEI